MNKVKIRDICSVITKGTTPTTLGFDFVNEGVNFIKIECIDESGNFLSDKIAHISEDCNTALKRSALKENDILFSIAGAIGRTAIVPKNLLPANTNQALAIIRIADATANHSYIKLALSSPLIYLQTSTQKQGVAQINLSLKNIGDLEIPYPNKDRQDYIVSRISEIQRALNCKKRQLSELDDLIKSRFIEMFGCIDLSPQLEEWKPLSELGTIYTGTTPSTADEENWGGDILWITPAEMDDDSFFISDTIRKITKKGQSSKSLTLMPTGTVLLSTRAPIGKVGIVAKPMTCNQGFKNFYCPSFLNSIYLYVLLKNNTIYLNSIGTGTTFKEISKSNCGKIRIPVPEISLQNEFADFVKLIDKSKFVCQLAEILFM